jgi:CRISPR type III-A/MTUBE-associated protein Csm6
VSELSLDNAVLFSAIGTTDPVRGGYDGSMLHIVRYYRPKKIYLYYSEKMALRDAEDNKCEIAIKILDPEAEVIKIFGDSKPQDFDGFFIEFNRIINNIAKENVDSLILLNVSSGTPQMKATLCLEAATTNKGLKAIQVSSPRKGPNVDQPVLEGNMDIFELMENNLDSLEDAENRCSEQNMNSFRHSILKSQIQSLISIYDYEGAERIVGEFGNQELEKLVKHCRLRFNLENTEALKVINEYGGYNLFPIAESRISRLVEYLNMLKIKQRRGQLTDMMIGLNPLSIEVMGEYLKEVLKVDMSVFYSIRKDEGARISLSKIKKRDPKFLEHLNKAFRKGFYDDSFLSIDFLHEAIVYYGNESLFKDIEFFGVIRKLNSELRNSSAHSLVSISEIEIVSMSSLTSRKIIEGYEKILDRIYGNRLPSEAHRIYDTINGFITEELNKY